MSEPRVIGIIGGMGPAATADLFSKLIAATPAARDQDHLHVLIDNNPRIPNRNDAIAGEGPSPGPHLAAGARRLEEAGADVLVMACNTAHAFQPDIEAAVSIPFVSMIEATADAAMTGKPACVGVLVADGCRRAGLYQRAFAARDVEALFLDAAAQGEFMRLVYRIKGGDTGEAVRAGMKGFGASLLARGAEVVVAACTEVPLVISAAALGAPLIDSSDALVKRVLAFATER